MNDDSLIQSAFEPYRAGDFEQAEDACRKILDAQPGNSEILHLLGLIYQQRGEYDRAVQNIKKALRLDPKNAEACYDLGNILQEKGEPTKAVTYYKKAIKLKPDYVEAYNNIGIALHDNMQLDKAIKFYKEALRIDPEYAEAYNNLGVAFQEKKRLDEAINNFQKALLLKPDYANAYHNLIEAVQGKGYGNKPAPEKHSVYAVYRCLFGADFIQESISSITDHVDKIFVFWDDTPRSHVTESVYKGATIQFPKKFDNIVEKIKELSNPKIELIYDHQDSSDNYLTHFVNDLILPVYDKPSIILFLEADHVFRADQIEKALDECIKSDYVFATTDQVEVWKGLRHRLPERPARTGAILCNMSKLDKMPSTLRHGGLIVMPKLSAYVHDFRFAVSEKTMYWKHLLSLAYAQTFGETMPFENWYEEKWLRWDSAFNNESLDISEQENIPGAMPYDVDELPEPVKRRILP